MSNYSQIDTRMDEVEFEAPRQPRFSSLYNPATKEFLGRTRLGWAQLLLFYFIYYVALASFFMAMMSIFLQYIIPTEEPLRTGEQSLLNLAPGLGYRPLPEFQSSLIRFSSRDPQSYIPYVQDLNGFLDVYESLYSKSSPRFANCDRRTVNRTDGDPKMICKFDLSELGSCSRANNYGYSDGEPCVILKLNKIFGWLPAITNGTHPMINCTGMNPTDVENFPSVKYFPSEVDANGQTYGVFNHHFYPYLRQSSYRSPLVAIQFKNVKKHILLIVECSLANVKNWAGTPAHFEILMD
jgi:sodium/potassium-transporting ATPase subunit beta